MLKKYLFFVLTIVCLTDACKKDNSNVSVSITSVDITDFTVDSSALSLEIGYTDTLHAIITPANATNETVTWKSDNTAIATVDQSGHVTGIAEGAANITATVAGGKTAVCQVGVISLKDLLYYTTNSAYQLLDANDEQVSFDFVNDTKSNITLTEIDIFNTKNSVVPFVKNIYAGSYSQYNIHPNQLFTSPVGTGNIPFQEGVNNGIVFWPVVVYFTTNGKNYKMSVSVVITSLTQL